MDEHLKKPIISFFTYEETEIADIELKENVSENENLSEIKTVFDSIRNNSNYFFIKEINQEYERIYISR